MACGYFGNSKIASQSGHVVDEFRPRPDCEVGDAGPACVHRNGNFEPPSKGFKNGKNVIQLLGGRRLDGSWPRRFAADVEEAGAGTLYRKGALDRALGFQELTAIGKAVWRDVQHAHNERAFAQNQRTGTEFEAKEFAADHER